MLLLGQSTMSPFMSTPKCRHYWINQPCFHTRLLPCVTIGPINHVPVQAHSDMSSLDHSINHVSVQAYSDLSWLDRSTMAETEAEEIGRGETLWRRVRMLVNGIRGEGPDFAGTVQYRAARSGRAFKTVMIYVVVCACNRRPFLLSSSKDVFCGRDTVPFFGQKVVVLSFFLSKRWL